MIVDANLLLYARNAADPRHGRARAWLEDALNGQTRVGLPHPTSHYRDVLGGHLRNHQVQGALVTDAQLAALAVDHGVALISTDSDFARFPEVRWIDPLR